MQFHDHGVNSEFVHDLVTLGYGDLPASDIVKMRDRGLSASALRHASAMGHRLTVRTRPSGCGTPERSEARPRRGRISTNPANGFPP